jgi:site-specific recombinase XerD
MLDQFSSYLTSHKSDLTKTTKQNYLLDVSRFLAWCETIWGSRFHPDKIQQEQISRYIHSLPLANASKQRYLSSLRRFFHFLKTEGIIPQTPFAQESTKKDMLEDFKNYLYVYNASELTIKNYLLDVKQFLAWLEREAEHTCLHMQVVEEYRTHLSEQQKYAQATIQRKQAAVRKYLLWSKQEGRF